jgi:hypothetical protein
MVDRNALIEALEPYGDIVFCDQNQSVYYLVVISNYSSDQSTFEGIATTFIVPFFPYLTNFSLIDGSLKAQYSSELPIETI